MILSVSHKTILLCFLSGFLAQAIKTFFGYIREKKLNLRNLVEPGGMPSSHSSSAATLTTCIGLASGFDSMLFTSTLFFSVIVMYEATGLRRAAGRQAKMLNQLLDRIYKKEDTGNMKLRELLGHTPAEVLLGALMGVVLAIAFF